MYDDYTFDGQIYGEMKNPNLYVTLESSGGIWSASTFPWQETYPWTINAPS